MTKALQRKAETSLQTVLVLADLAAVLVAMLLAYGIRFHSLFTLLVPVTKGVPPLGLYLAAGLAISIVWLPLFAALGLYRPRNRLEFASQFDLTLRGVTLGFLVALALSFFYREASFSRLVMGLVGVLMLLLMPAFRLWFGRWVARRLPAAGVAVVGSGVTAAGLAARLSRQAVPGIRFVGLFADGEGGDGDGRVVSGDAAGSPSGLRCGSIDAVIDAARAGAVDRAFLALDPAEGGRLTELIAALMAAEVDLEWVPVLPEMHTGRLRVEAIEGLPVIPLGEFPLLGWNGVVKRAMDLGLSGFGLTLLAPLLGGLALAVRLSSPGAVIYRQERIGRDGRHFDMLKFRSMRQDAEAQSGPVRTQRNDPRTTAVGRFMRRTSLDELPQLWNVIRGEMSLVGPRPERPALIDELVEGIPDYLQRHRVKAGMTGWAQVHGLRGAESSMEERILCDLYYIENWSIWLDLRILVRTVLGLFREPNAF